MGSCGIAVIGCGVVGASIAYELASRGADVEVIDARGAGLGATQASAGMLAPYVEGFGRPVLDMAALSLSMYDDFVARVMRDGGRPVHYRRTGSLQVAVSEEAAAGLAATAAAASSRGVRCSLLDAAQTREAEPQLTPEVSAGLLIDEHGFVSATDLVGAAVAAAIECGARVRAPERARSLARSSAGVDIQLEHDRLQAKQVVLATGCWSGQIDIGGASGLPVRPVRGQLVEISSPPTPLARITWSERCYLVPAAEGRVLAGATMEEAGFDERPTVAGVRDLLEAASDLVPILWQQTFGGTRVGLRPATPDEMPIIGRSSRIPDVILATGHFRNGVLLAPLTARLVADLALDGREDPLLAAASPARFGNY